MHRDHWYRTSAVSLTLFFVSTHLAEAAVVLVPSNLNPGDMYHLAFVSSTARNAASQDIADYDAHVQAAADAAGIGIGSALGDIAWKAIASTPTVNAIEHLDIMGPVYRLDDTFVASDETDLFDRSIAVPMNVTEAAITVSPDVNVWTGTNPDGMAAPSGSTAGLGNPAGPVILGESEFTTGRWLRAFFAVTSNEHAFYAVSEKLTVKEPDVPAVPEPSSLFVWTAFLSFAVYCRRNRYRAA